MNEVRTDMVARRTKRSRGYVLVMLAICLGVMLSLAALAIDTGRLYQQHTQIQRFARQAANAMLGLRAQKGWWWVYFGRQCDNPATACDLTFTGPGVPPNVLAPPPGTNNILSLRVRAYRAFVENMAAAGMNPGNLISPSLVGCGLGGIVDDSDLTGTGCSDVPGVTYDHLTDTVRVNVQYDAPTFLAGRAPILGLETQSCTAGRPGHSCMRFTATARLQPAVILMVLDASGSMRCNVVNPAGLDTCTPAGPGDRKIDRLITASIAFYRMFNPIQDRIGVLPFNLVAAPANRRILIPPADPSGFGRDQTAWTAFRDFFPAPAALAAGAPLFPASNTNHADAFNQAVGMLATAPAGERVVVGFTDGAPTAAVLDPGEVNINGASLDARLDEVLGVGVGPRFTGNPAFNREFFLYSVQWNPPGGGATIEGPGPLIHNTTAGPINARAALFQYEIGSVQDSIFPIAAGAPPTPLVVPCTSQTLTGASWLTNALNYYGNAANFQNILTDCLTQDFGFRMPGMTVPPTRDATEWNSLDIQFTDRDSDGNTYFRQLFYHAALEASNRLRVQSQATVYGIGLGPALMPGAFTNQIGGSPQSGDPYNDHRAQWPRKDGYMRWLLNDEESAGDHPFRFPGGQTRVTNLVAVPAMIGSPPTIPNPHSAANPPFQIAVGFERAAQITGGGRPGYYYPTNRADELRDIFTQVAKQILLRLRT